MTPRLAPHERRGDTDVETSSPPPQPLVSSTPHKVSAQNNTGSPPLLIVAINISVLPAANHTARQNASHRGKTQVSHRRPGAASLGDRRRASTRERVEDAARVKEKETDVPGLHDVEPRVDATSQPCSRRPNLRSLPEVERVVPSHGVEDGGTVVLVYGRHFGEGRLRVVIGGNPCASTRRLSDTALQCTSPKGSGTHLRVHVVSCECAEDANAMFADTTLGVSFSYHEAAARQIRSFTRSTVLQPGNRHMQLSADAFTDPYEVRFFDAALDQKVEFALIPSLIDLLPASDAKQRFDTCAVVGRSGALAGSRSGSAIDAFGAVFRTDNSPSALRFSADVGRRTTFQVLSRDWGEALMKRSGATGTPHVARWWLDVATVILYHPASLRSFAALRTLYPDAGVVFLSPDLEAAARNTFHKLKASAEDALLQRASSPQHPEEISSLLYAVFIALQTCANVSVFGVLPSCDASSTTWRCKKSSYFEDVEISHEQQARTASEEMLILALEHANILNVKRPNNSRQRDITDENSASRHLRPSAHSTICSADCNGQMARENQGDELEVMKQCPCDVCPCRESGAAVICGGSCDAVVAAPALFKDIKLVYSGPLLMSRATEHLNATSEHEAASFTNGVDGQMGSLFPVDDSYMFDQQADQQRRLWRSAASRYESGAQSTLPPSNTSHRLGRCAAVGNSGALLNHRQGGDVDLHDVVYRFNQAPVDYYQTYVGSRTSHESLNSAWVKSSIEAKNHAASRQRWNWRKVDTTNVLFEMYDPVGIRYKSRENYAIKERWWRKAYTRLRVDMPERKLLVLSPQFMTWAYELYLQLQQRFQEQHFGEFRGEKPMSGFYAILFLLQVCDEVDIYGFTPYKEADRNSPETLSDAYHYFDGATPRKGSHSFDLTRYIYELLSVAFPGRFKLHD